MESGQPPYDEHVEQFVELLGQHERPLLAYIFSLVADWNVAEDLAQETRLRLWRQFDQYDPNKDFGAWARTIAHYLVLQHRTHQSRERLQFQDDVLETVAEAAANRMSDTPARLAALAACVEALSQAKQQLLRRLYSGRETMRDLAAQERVSHASMRQRIMRIRGALRKCIERRLKSENV